MAKLKVEHPKFRIGETVFEANSLERGEIAHRILVQTGKVEKWFYRIKIGEDEQGNNVLINRYFSEEEVITKLEARESLKEKEKQIQISE